MKIEVTQIKGINIAEIISDNVIIKEAQDALDLMAEASSQGSGKIIIHVKNIVPDFFDLKSGLAGEIFQNFQTTKFNLL
jgi:hypothetical protein